jgi:predicted lipid-binding transport protein (Tim44 family)
MSIRLPNWRILLTLFFCLGMALAPALADARAGSSFGGGSFSGGSRGSRSFESNGGAPLSRSLTPAPTPGFSGSGYGGGFFSRHPFLTGLFGGFLGSMLFGGGLFGHMFGGLLTLLIIGGLIFLVVRLLFGGAGAAFAGGGFAPRSVGAAAVPNTRFRGRDVGVVDVDLNAFQLIHAAVQEAWSRGDLGRLRRLMTPEMASYFSEELTKNASQGVQNIVSDVRLLKGDVLESWEEGDLQYATARLRWSANDYVVREGREPSDATAIVSGNPRVPVEAEEIWTFVRRRGGGEWLLSAVQQV